MSSRTPTRARGPPSCPSGRRGGVPTSVDGSAGPRRIRLLHQRVLRGAAVWLVSANRSQGLWHRPAGCRGGLRTNAAAQRFVDESREGPTAFAGVMSRPSGRGAASSSASGLSRRRGAVSRQLRPGAPRSAGARWQLEVELFGARSTARGRQALPRRRGRVPVPRCRRALRSSEATQQLEVELLGARRQPGTPIASREISGGSKPVPEALRSPRVG